MGGVNTNCDEHMLVLICNLVKNALMEFDYNIASCVSIWWLVKICTKKKMEILLVVRADFAIG